MKDKIVLCGILALIATLAVLTASAYNHDQTYNANATYFVAEDIGVLGYCNDTLVAIWTNTSIGIGGGQIQFDYDPCCANVTDFQFNTTNWELFPAAYLEYGRVRIVFSTATLGGRGPGPVHLGDLTIHCNNTSYCETNLIWNLTNPAFITRLDDDMGTSMTPVNWANGVFRCEAASGIANHVVISEVYADAVNDSGNSRSEFVELYNPTDSAKSLVGWTLSDREGTITLSGTISASEFYLVGMIGYDIYKDNASWPNADIQAVSSNFSLANPGDEVILNNSAGEVVDTLGWGTATTNETLNAETPGETESLQRKVSDTINEDGVHGPAWDTGNNSADFFIQATPNPQDSASGPLPPIPELSTLMLLMTGLVTLVGYVIVKKGRDN